MPEWIIECTLCGRRFVVDRPAPPMGEPLPRHEREDLPPTPCAGADQPSEFIGAKE